MTYGASGGVICSFEGVNRRANRDSLWVLGRVRFEPVLRRNVVSIQSEMKVLEAVDENGRDMVIPPVEKPRWDSSGRVELVLAKQNPLATTVAKIRVETAVAVCTQWTVFTVMRLDHLKTITMKQNGVEVRIDPLGVVARNGENVWRLPINVHRSLGRNAESIHALRDEIRLVTDEGKQQSCSGKRTSHSANHEEINVHLAIDSFDPATTSLLIREPAAIEIAPVILTFHNVSIIDR